MLWGAFVEDVDHVVVWLVELCLREVWQQAFVAAVAVDDQNFLAAVAGHLVGGFLQQGELQVAAVGYRAGFVAGFDNLAEIIFGEDDGVFLLGGVQRGVAYIEQVGADGQVRAVLLQDAEWQNRQVPCERRMPSTEVGGGKFFPMHGELRGLRMKEAGKGENCGQNEDE